MRFLFAFLLTLAIALLAAAPRAVHAAPEVTNVTIQRLNTASGNTPSQTRFTLETNQAVPYRAFVLNGPPRLVIDLPKMGWSAPLNKGDRNRTIKSYRKGIYQQDTLRIVLDLNRPAILQQHKRIDAAQGRGWRYSFDLKPVSAVEFQKALNAVYVGGGAPQTATQGTAQGTATTTPATASADTSGTKSATPPKATQTATSANKKPLIVIDPGHGGVDPGAIATNGAYEKNITLATAKEVKRQLESSGKYHVKLTRETDIFIKLPERVRIARRASADLFISLHADTIGRSVVRGASVYTLSSVASDSETAKLAARENAVDTLVNVDVGDVDSDVADILIDLVTRDTMNQSKILAETVVSTFKTNGIATLPQRPHRSAGFAVLKAPDIPSVLIEMGYLSNRQEADMLVNATYRAKLARTIARTIDRFYSETSSMAAY